MIDARAESGFTAAAADYARGRPTYPDDAWDILGRELALGADAVVVDLAAGTGQVARGLRGRVRRVIAVEPVAAMRAELARRVPDVVVLAGAAEAIPLADGAVDTVLVGEAFHWFDAPVAAGEIARVLRPGGGLGVLWNIATPGADGTPWRRVHDALVTHHERAAGAYPSIARWRAGLEDSGRFAPLRDATTDHVQRLPLDDFLAQARSWSWVANMPAAERRHLLDDLAALVPDDAALAIPYRTEITWTRRHP